MAFEREPLVEPVAIGDISIDIFDPESSSGEQRRITAHILVEMSDGSTRRRSLDLGPHLSAASITQLTNLVGTVRQKANDEMLPEETA